MNSKATTILLWCIGAVITAGAVWLWFDKMEQRWVALPYTSPEAEKNHMLAAERWLIQHQHTVQSYTNLAQVPLENLPNGMMLIPENDGIVTAEQSAALLQWVQRGNTLVMRPPSSKKHDADLCGEHTLLLQELSAEERKKNPAQEIVWNPIAEKLGVKVALRFARGEPDDEVSGRATSSQERPGTQKFKPSGAKNKDKSPSGSTPCLTGWTAPASRYPLWVDVTRAALVATPQEPPPQYNDDSGEGVRIYPEGQGHIALIADNYFSNTTLGIQDHAELLLALAQLTPQTPHTVIVEHLDMPRWYELIWNATQFAIISAAFALLALLWMGLRRFGPMLPEPSTERRSLIEHIDASGRWLWKAPQGPEQLLQAARAPVMALLSRKVPQYQRLTQDERVHAIVNGTNATTPFSYADIHSALFAPASTQPAAFTRQIHTLTQLKKHYD